MATTRKTYHGLEIITFLLIAAAVSSFFVWFNYQNSKNHLVTPIDFNNTTDTTVAPTEDPVLKTTTASQISPDGTSKVILKTIPNPDGTSIYKATTTDASGSAQQEVYTTTASDSAKLSVPFNTWSPDDKYIFLQKGDSDALVFRADGSPIVTTASPEASLDVSDIFQERGIPNTVSQVTGWASETLLIVNTKTTEGKKQSYWFEVPTKAIIPLSGDF